MSSPIISEACTEADNAIIERQTTEKLESEHRRDNLVLLAYVILLILSVLTVWGFKHRRFKYIHSSGLAIIYGLIAGAIFRYCLTAESFSSATYHLKPQSENFSCQALLPPQKMHLIIDTPLLAAGSKPLYYLYSFERSTKSLTVSDDTAHFNPEIFFNILLPPIIFTAGYSMKKRHFFRNIGAICTYAFFGTAIAAFGIAAICFGTTRIIPSISQQLNFTDCVLFGSMLSATDPVTVLAIFNELHVDFDLYALVFGESILNDAVAIAFTHAVQSYDKLGSFDAILPTIGSFITMFLGSLAIGVFTGLITALLTKYTHIKNFPALETALFVLMSYSTFLLAEGIGYTGIVSVLFCGIIQAHYTYNNLSRTSKTWTKEFFELLNFLSENFIFTYLGVATFTFRDHYWRVDFIIIALVACILARAVQIYLLSMIINFIRHIQAYGCRRRPLSSSTFHVTSYVETSHNIDKDEENQEFDKWNQDSKQPNNYNGTSSNSPQVIFPGNNVRIPLSHQHMLLFAGLRGAMAFSLAARNASTYMRQMFFSTTIVIVIFSVLMCGSFVTPFMHWLDIQVGVVIPSDEDDNDPAAVASRREQKEKHYRERTGCWHLWTSFDNRFLKPFLTNSVPTLVETLPAFCQRLAQIFTTDEQRRLVESSLKQEFVSVVHSDNSDLDNRFAAMEEAIVSSSSSSPSNPDSNILDLSEYAMYHVSDKQVVLNVRKAKFRNEDMQGFHQ